jgi:transposase
VEPIDGNAHAVQNRGNDRLISDQARSGTGCRHTTTFARAPRTNGFVAPVVVNGARNGALFRAYREQKPGPALRPGHVLVLGSLARHAAGARQTVERAWARLLHLPPYGPDLNPIELTW